jgi:hypothetical protein
MDLVRMGSGRLVLSRSCGTVGPTRVSEFFLDETNDLNNTGDFLAGVFAFPAFVLLAAAVLTQRQELHETREQLKKSQNVIDAQLRQIDKQNDISHRAAQANYKLAIYERRLSVYQRLSECAYPLAEDGIISKETRQQIGQTAKDAKFVFAEEVNEYITALNYKSYDMMRIEVRLKRAERKWNEDEVEAWNNALENMHGLEDWFHSNFKYETLDEKFTPSLKLPEDI